MEKLTIQEEEAMLYIWELGSCFVKDIVAKYPKPAPPYTTVASIVKKPGAQAIYPCRTCRQYLPSIPRLYAKANTNVPL
mgnify:CR=1 FL=1